METPDDFQLQTTKSIELLPIKEKKIRAEAVAGPSEEAVTAATQPRISIGGCLPDLFRCAKKGSVMIMIDASNRLWPTVKLAAATYGWSATMPSRAAAARRKHPARASFPHSVLVLCRDGVLLSS